MKALLPGLVMAILSTSVFAQSIEERMAMAAQNIPIEEIVTVPIRNLKAVESEGQIVFMSDNGRFVLIGQLIDVWQRKSLDTMSQISDAVTRLSFENMGLNIDDLNTVTVGQGSAQVVAFVDPLCESCITLIDQAESLGDRYSFKFVFVPALGNQSVQSAKNISCANDKKAALQSVRNGTSASLTGTEDCDGTRFQTTLIAADLMGINGVPFIVAPNGEIGRGMPDNLVEWLKDREQK